MNRTKEKHRATVPDHGPGLIPPDQIFDRVLSHGPIIPDAHLPFEERVERAWRRLMAGFHEHERERLREVLNQKLRDI